MSGTVLLLGIAGALRTFGAMAFGTSLRGFIPFLGWQLCLASVWIAAGALGVFSPLWPAITLAIVCSLIDPTKQLIFLMPAAEAVLALWLGLMSMPIVSNERFIIMMLIFPLVGVAADKFASYYVQSYVQMFCAISGSVLLLAIGIYCPSQIRLLPAHHIHTTLVCSVTPGLTGDRVDLDTGAIGWLNRPHGDGPFPGLIFFHGADPRGSHQPAAVALRRAFLHAGFIVLAVDHPGFGASPPVAASSPPDAWDPLPTDLAAVKFVRNIEDINGIYIAGHSMGCVDVLRLIGHTRGLQGAILLGMSHIDYEERAQHWLDRFHNDRRMNDRVSLGTFLQIYHQYYNRVRLIEELTGVSCPVLDIRFRYEAQNIRESRDKLFEMLPGRKEKWEVNATHYVNSVEPVNIILGHTPPVRDIARRLKSFVKKTSHGNDIR